MASTLSPPKPLHVTVLPVTPDPHCRTPTKPRKRLTRMLPIAERDQIARKLALSYPDVELEETDISDLMTETRTRTIVDTAKTEYGDLVYMFDDGTYEILHLGSSLS